MRVLSLKLLELFKAAGQCSELSGRKTFLWGKQAESARSFLICPSYLPGSRGSGKDAVMASHRNLSM